MTTENPEPLTPPPFDEADTTVAQSADTPSGEPSQPVVADTVGEAATDVTAQAEIPKPAGGDAAAGAESAEDNEEQITFDLLIQLDKKNLKILLGKINPTVIATALAGTDTEAQEEILDVFSKKVATALRAEVGKLGTPTQDSVEKAQEEIVEIAENLNEEGTISFDSLFEEETESTAKSTAQPSSAAASKTIERHKTVKEKRAEAFTDYFKSVKTEDQFLKGIFEMPRDPKLREVVSVQELENLSGELFSKIFGLFLSFEAKKKEKSSKEIIEFVEAGIKEDQIPAGFQGAFRAVIYAEMTQKAEPVSSDAKNKARVDAILADLAQTEKEKQTGASDVSSSKPKRSSDWLLKSKGASRSASPAPDQPVATKTTETPSTPPPESEVTSATSVPQVETKPLTSSDTSGREQGIPLMITRDMEQRLTDMGIVKEDRDKLKPAEAWRILNGEKDKIEETKPSSLEAAAPVVEASTAVDTSESLGKAEVSVALESIPGPEGWTPEKINALTFENIFDLNDDDFRSVVGGAAISYQLGVLLKDMSDSLVQRARSNVNFEADFVEGFLQGVSDPEEQESWKSNFVENAKGVLLAKNLEAGNQTPATEEPEIILPSRPTPIEQEPATPPPSTSTEEPQNRPASSGWWSKVVNFFRRSASEQARIDLPVSPEVEKVWTLDEIKALTFENISSLGTSDFKVVVGVGNGLMWGTALADAKDADVRAKVASFMNNQIDLRNFQEGLKETHEQGEIESAKARCATYAKKQLIKVHLSY